MNHPNGVVKSAKILNELTASLMAIAGILLLTVPGLDTDLAQRILLGILFGLTGASKIFGYFSNDLYRLAFQFDFFNGIFCELLTLVIVLMPRRVYFVVSVLITVYLLLDGLMKTQISLDCHRFGIRYWWLILVIGLVLSVVSILSVIGVLAEVMALTNITGILLIVDGLVNFLVTATTVRVRAKKKNLSVHFGLEDEE